MNYFENKSFTTLAQSDMLVKSGLDPETADGHYWQGPSTPGSNYMSDAISFYLSYAKAIETDKLMPHEGEVVPTFYKPMWSVSKLFQLMPKRIKYDGSFFDLKIVWVDPKSTGMEDAEMKPVLMYSKFSGTCLCIQNPVRRLEKWQGERYETDGCDTLIECAITMICWLLEAGYMKKHMVPTSSVENMDQTEYFHQPEDTKEDEDD